MAMNSVGANFAPKAFANANPITEKPITEKPTWFESTRAELGVVVGNTFSFDKSRYGWKEALLIVVILAFVALTIIGFVNLYKATHGTPSTNPPYNTAKSGVGVDYVFGGAEANGWDYLAMVLASIVAFCIMCLMIVYGGPYIMLFMH